MKKSHFIAKILTTSLAAALFLTACGNSSSYDSTLVAEESAAEYDGGSDFATANYASDTKDYEYDSDVTDDNPGSSRKLITTVDIDAETEDFDKTINDIEKKVKELGGYVESSSLNNSNGRKNISLTARIPASKLDDFVSLVESGNNVTRKTVKVDDVTLNYVDMEARKNALKTEEERLIEILAQAETVEDILTVEERLAEVRYELESIESQLRTYDNLVDYSTVNLDISEVAVYTPVEKETVGQRIARGFKQELKEVGEFLADLFVFIVIHIPDIVVFAVFAAIIFLIVKALDKHGKKKAQKQALLAQNAREKLAAQANAPQVNVSQANAAQSAQKSAAVNEAKKASVKDKEKNNKQDTENRSDTNNKD